jgi:SAM-dependent methyltransferase
MQNNGCRCAAFSRESCMIEDVPSPIDLRMMSDAREWTANAMIMRPWRTEFFTLFATEIVSAPIAVKRILELGSGPGFLAEHLLQAMPDADYVALDFSSAMHQLAAERLGPLASRVQFIERSFLEPEWNNDLCEFDCVVTHQAVHELRHKYRASTLHAQARQVLVPNGFYLVSDHYFGEGGMQNDQLYMTVTEQADALHAAGFRDVQPLLIKGGLVLHRAARFLACGSSAHSVGSRHSSGTQISSTHMPNSVFMNKQL